VPRFALIAASRGATRVIPRLHRPAQASSTNVYKELLEINQEIASIAVTVATAAVREVLAEREEKLLSKELVTKKQRDLRDATNAID
jgi:hypothetical protein